MKILLFILCLVLIVGSVLILEKSSISKLPLVTSSLGINPPKVIRSNVLSDANTTQKKPENNLSNDLVFRYFDPNQDSKNNPNEYTIIATGDIIPARSVNTKLTRLNNFKFPFEKTLNVLNNADIVFINLESPLIPNCQLTDEGMRFCGNQKFIEGLLYGNVSVASFANNHLGNYGIRGIEDTADLLKKNNISVTGNGQPAVLIVKRKKFGFLGYNNIGGKEQGISWADIPTLQQDIKDLKKQVDFVITTFHWGVEYTASPSAVQIELAHAAIDAGADLIIGNHPHWVQGIEKYKGKFITYAHGNFIFDQMWSRETQEGVLGKYTFNNEGLTDVKFFPIIIEDYSQPRFANIKEADKILSRMKEVSQWN